MALFGLNTKRTVSLALTIALLVGGMLIPNIEAQEVGECYVASSGCYSEGCGWRLPGQTSAAEWAYIWFYCWNGKSWSLRGGTSGCCGRG